MLYRHRYRTPALALALALAITVAAAAPARAAESAEAPAPASGFRADYLAQIARLKLRAMALAEHIPPASYTVSAAGRHSLAECLSELSAASRRILRGLEAPVPAAGEGPESAAAKVRIIEDLTVTLDAAQQAVEQTPGAGLEAPIDFLGRRWTVRALFLLLLGQMHEGLGHAAAHAESLGIVPPWLREKRASEATDD